MLLQSISLKQCSFHLCPCFFSEIPLYRASSSTMTDILQFWAHRGKWRPSKIAPGWKIARHGGQSTRGGARSDEGHLVSPVVLMRKEKRHSTNKLTKFDPFLVRFFASYSRGRGKVDSLIFVVDDRKQKQKISPSLFFSLVTDTRRCMYHSAVGKCSTRKFAQSKALMYWDFVFTEYRAYIA